MSWADSDRAAGRPGRAGDHPWKEGETGRSAEGFVETCIHERIAGSRGSVPMISAARRSARRGGRSAGADRVGGEEHRGSVGGRSAAHAGAGQGLKPFPSFPAARSVGFPPCVSRSRRGWRSRRPPEGEGEGEVETDDERKTPAIERKLPELFLLKPNLPCGLRETPALPAGCLCCIRCPVMVVGLK
jgi:hypothetical protein